MATGIPRTKWNGNQERKSGGLASELTSYGELTLTYPNKSLESSVLAGERAECSVVWQVVRAAQAGAANGLYYGDNLGILLQLLDDKSVAGKVRLVYIDPPYATKSVFQSRGQKDAYCDLLSGAEYIEFIRKRLIILRELLASDGSIYVHLDENMAFHVKIVMDEVFGPKNFRNWITRKKCNPKNYTQKTYGNVSDFILFYSRSDDYVWNRSVEEWTPERAAKEYEYKEKETGRVYKKVPVHAPGVRNGETGKAWRGKNPPPGKHWQYPPRVLDEMDQRGEIYWSPTGNPRRKVYLDESAGVPVQDIWTEFRDAHNQNVRVTGYPTEKNPALMDRIIRASSNPDDIVLDCFSGSGTTLEIASRLGRRWIGIDNSLEAISTTLRRFSHGRELMGDFVQEEQKPPAVKSLNLFDLHGDSNSSVEHRQGLDAITDFSVWRTENSSHDIESLLEHWRGSRVAHKGFRLAGVS